MLRPQGFDLRLADERGGAPADSVDGEVGLGAPGPRVDVLYDAAVARIPLAALTNLRSERRPLEHLQLAANADGAKVVHDALAHIEVRRERHVLEVEAVGEAGLRQQLFGLLEVVLRHGHVLAVPP